MREPVSQTRRGDCLDPNDLGRFENPLDFIAEDHFREREICASLDRAAETGAFAPVELDRVFCFLSEELPLHLQDEEEDLFPMMRRRCAPEDEIEKAIDRLLADHVHANEDAPAILAILQLLREGRATLGTTAKTAFRVFAGHSRRHLVFENAIILPLARARLSKRDLATLRARMMKRRESRREGATSHAE